MDAQCGDTISEIIDDVNKSSFKVLKTSYKVFIGRKTQKHQFVSRT